VSIHWWDSSCAGKRNIRKLPVRAPRLAKELLFYLDVPLTFSERFGAAHATKAGWKHVSPLQDVELGKKAALDAAKQLPSCNAPKVDAYLTQLGMRLASKLPTAGAVPFEFHCVNTRHQRLCVTRRIRVYQSRRHRSRDNEGQLAAVIAHELSHVALRHGTNQPRRRSGHRRFWELPAHLRRSTAARC